MAQVIPGPYLSLREAIWTLARARNAGEETSDDAKHAHKLGFDQEFSRKELQDAADALWSHIDAGKLTVWAEHPGSNAPLRIEPALLDFVGVRRYGVSDLSYLRPPHRLLHLLAQRFGPSWRDTQLLLDRTELARVERNQRRTRKRKQAPPGSAKPVGRPNKVSGAKPAIRKVVDAKQWRGTESLKKLTSILSRAPYNLGVSTDTAARALDELFQETRDRRFQRLRKASRTAGSAPKSTVQAT
jgi:hypothetical protein